MEALSQLQSLFDAMLGLALLWLAWQSLGSAGLFRAIVLFIAFGLLIALVWVRLGAVDVALAEAAIGAGLTGALLLAALARLDASARRESGRSSEGNSRDVVQQPKANHGKYDAPKSHE